MRRAVVDARPRSRQSVQREGDIEHGDDEHRRRSDRLLVEELRHREERGQTYRQRSVALAPRLHELEARHQEQQRHAGIAPEEIAVMPADRERAGEDDRDQPVRMRRRTTGAQHQHAGDDEADAGDAEPDRQADDLRQLREQQQPGEHKEDARIERGIREQVDLALRDDCGKPREDARICRRRLRGGAHRRSILNAAKARMQRARCSGPLAAGAE